MSSVKKFRKKPVVIEAMQWEGPVDENHVKSVIDFLDDPAMSPYTQTSRQGRNYEFTHNKLEDSLVIKTLEGELVVSIGDWIIKGVQSEFYPCKPDIFEATYTEVEE